MGTRDFEKKIRVLPLVANQSSTTAPTYATTSSAASRAQSIQGWMEATVVLSIGANASTTLTSSFTCKLQESNTLVDGDFTDIPHPSSTNAARFFDSQTTPGTLIVAASADPQTFLISILVEERKKYIRAVLTNGSNALACHIDLVLHEPRFDKNAQVADLRVVDTGGVAV